MKSVLYELLRWLAVVAAVGYLLTFGASNRISMTQPEVVQQAVYERLDTENMQKASNQMIKRLYGIQPEEYAYCTLYYPLTVMDVGECLLVKLSDASQAEALYTAAQQRIDYQVSIFESYGAEQMELLNHHTFMEAQGGYFVFVIAPDADAAHTAFIQAL